MATVPSHVRPSIFARPAAPRRVHERAVVSVVLLALVGLLLRAHPVDRGLASALNAWHVGLLGALGDAVYVLFEPVPAITLTVLITAVVWVVTRRWSVAAAFAGVVALTWIPSDVLKLVVQRSRPEGSWLSHPFSPAQVDPSFPSGHMVFVTAMVLVLLMLLRGSRWWLPVAVAGVAVVGVVAFALCVDAVHWPTDVAASIVWAFAVAPAARIVWVDNVLGLVLRRVGQTGRHRAVDGEDAV